MRNKMVKLNLGCGPDGISGWINYDWGMLPVLSKLRFFRHLLVKLGILGKSYEVDWPEINLADIRRGLPLMDDSVDFVYCSHVLEHFEKWEVVVILEECRRVLKTGGVLRLVVPDLKKIVKNYSGADKFCREFYGFSKDKKTWLRIFIRGHQWMYDEDNLREALRDAEFRKIKICEFRRGAVPDLRKLDLKLHRDLSVYAEAEK